MLCAVIVDGLDKKSRFCYGLHLIALNFFFVSFDRQAKSFMQET